MQNYPVSTLDKASFQRSEHKDFSLKVCWQMMKTADKGLDDAGSWKQATELMKGSWKALFINEPVVNLKQAASFKW